MSATTLYQGNFGPVSTNSNPMLYDKTFDKINEISVRVPMEGMPFVSERDTHRASYTEGEVSSELGLPMVSNDTEDIRLLQPLFGHDVTITLTQYRAGIIITESAEREQDTRMLKQMMKGLPDSAKRKVEYLIANLFNNGFATETGGDGSYAFAADHTKIDTQAGTWSNLLTASDFTTGNYSLAWQRAQSMTTERGFPDPRKITEVVYPVAMHQDVMTVLGSPKVAENALNGINPYAGDAKATCYHYLTSSTAHFYHLDYDKDNEGFLLVWSVRPNYKPISDSKNPDLVWGTRLKMKCGAGVKDARNWLANAGV